MEIKNNLICFPKLYTKNSRGTIRFWSIFVFSTDEEKDFDLLVKNKINENFKEDKGLYGVWYSISGQENGKQTISKPHFTKGKNIGKTNETTPLQQALNEATAKHKKKIEAGAVEEKQKIKSEKDLSYKEFLELVPSGRLNFMTYHSVKKNWNKVIYPVFIQYKLDGIHLCVFNKGKLDLYTRGKKSSKHEYLLEILKFIPVGFYVFGEFWQKNIIRQDLNSLVSDKSAEIIFNIFDCFDFSRKNMNFAERLSLVDWVVEKANNKFIQKVETKIAKNREEVEIFYQKALKMKMEGIMIKNKIGLYEYGIFNTYRTFNALKYKPRLDSEFEIINFKQGVGKNKGLIIFEAKAGKNSFWVVPKWTEKKRKEVYVEQMQKFSYKNKMATIEFDRLSKEGIPIQPYLISIN